MSDPLLEVENLSLQFKVKTKILHGSADQGKFKTVLNSVSFAIKEGETFGIVGETGSGKTTLARTLVGIYKPKSCTIKLQGKEINFKKREDILSLRRSIGIVFQDPVGSLNPRLRVFDIIAEGLPNLQKMRKGEKESKVREAAKLVELQESKLESYPTELSGGEKQRVSLARTLAGGKKIIVLDEPTSSLDVSIQAQILNLLIKLKRELSISYIFITHDLNVIKFMCDRVAVLYYGQLLEEGSTIELFERPSHPYTYDLIHANVTLSSTNLYTTDHESGEPSTEGCVYKNSCPKRFEPCEMNPPVIVRNGVRVKCWLYETQENLNGVISEIKKELGDNS